MLECVIFYRAHAQGILLAQYYLTHPQHNSREHD